MVNEQLLTYIRSQLQKGIAPEEVKEALFTRGWVTADIEEGFKNIASPTPPDVSEAAASPAGPVNTEVKRTPGISAAVTSHVPAKSDLAEKAAPETETSLNRISPLPAPAGLPAANEPPSTRLVSPSTGGETIRVPREAPVVTSRVPTAGDAAINKGLTSLKRKIILGAVLLTVVLLALVLGWSLFNLRQATSTVGPAANGAPPSPAPTPPVYQSLTPAAPPSPEAVPAGREATPAGGQITPPPAPPETDLDNDGLPDRLETCYGTDPRKSDTDGDGWQDGDEATNGYNPLGPGKLPEDLKARCP